MSNLSPYSKGFETTDSRIPHHADATVLVLVDGFEPSTLHGERL
jgi:hypothetical protein